MSNNYMIGCSDIATYYGDAAEPYFFGPHILCNTEYCFYKVNGNEYGYNFQNYLTISKDSTWVAPININNFTIGNKLVQAIEKGTMPIIGQPDTSNIFKHCFYAHQPKAYTKYSTADEITKFMAEHDGRELTTIKRVSNDKSGNRIYIDGKPYSSGTKTCGIVLVGGGGGSGGFFYADQNPNGSSDDLQISPGRPGGGGGIAVCALTFLDDASLPKSEHYAITDYSFDIWSGCGGTYGANNTTKYSHSKSQDINGKPGADGKSTQLFLKIKASGPDIYDEVSIFEESLNLIVVNGGSGGKGGIYSSSYKSGGNGGSVSVTDSIEISSVNLLYANEFTGLIKTLWSSIFKCILSKTGGTGSNFDVTEARKDGDRRNCGIANELTFKLAITQAAEAYKDNDSSISYKVTKSGAISTFNGLAYGKLLKNKTTHQIKGGHSLGTSILTNNSNYNYNMGTGGDAGTGTETDINKYNTAFTEAVPNKDPQASRNGRNGGFYLFY